MSVLFISVPSKHTAEQPEVFPVWDSQLNLVLKNEFKLGSEILISWSKISEWMIQNPDCLLSAVWSRTCDFRSFDPNVAAWSPTLVLSYKTPCPSTDGALTQISISFNNFAWKWLHKTMKQNWAFLVSLKSDQHLLANTKCCGHWLARFLLSALCLFLTYTARRHRKSWMILSSRIL